MQSSIFELSAHVGTVLQDPDGQFIGLTVGEDIAFALENSCTPQDKMHEITTHAAELVVSLDGDLLVHPDDLMRVLHSDKECVCGAVPCTEDPMLMKTLTQNGQIYGVGFSREEGEYEWTGLAQVKTARLTPGDHHVCDMMVPLLPLPMELIRTKEIDTMADYEHAVAWVKSGYAD